VIAIGVLRRVPPSEAADSHEQSEQDQSAYDRSPDQQLQLPIGETVPEDLFRPQLGAPHHYGYVVEDIEATVNRLVDQLGAGPFFLFESVPLENVLSRGEPAEFIHNSAFGYCGRGAIELIEIISLAPERVEEAFSVPRPGIHHVGYAVPPTEVADLRSSLDQRGLPQYLSAQLGEIDNTFHDASASLGHDIEVHVDSQGLRDFFEMVSGGAEGWDGSEPLRPVAS
jgi:Glyoxalase/Bleomycin resistance protein/Dioxygenase superfamily